MSALTVGTDPVALPGDRRTSVIQNLGPGVVYFDTDGDVTVGTGLKLEVGDAFEFTHQPAWAGAIFLVASQAATDVRYAAVR